jgi:hypothetical protein
MENSIERLGAKAKKILLKGGLAATIFLSGISARGPVKGIENTETEPPAQSETLPTDFVLVDVIDTSCQQVLEWTCQGWPVECGHLKEVEYCPLDTERENLFIDPSIQEGEKAFLINLVKDDQLQSTWVVENPDEILEGLDSNLPQFYKSVHIDYDGQGIE